jgi:hypothetical protein
MNNSSVRSKKVRMENLEFQTVFYDGYHQKGTYKGIFSGHGESGKGFLIQISK